jgi:predicted nucleotidyltransferase
MGRFRMEPHHAASIRNLIAEFEQKPDVLALILGGSIAHGFARPDSDIDVAIVVPTADFQSKQRAGLLHYNNRTLCTYPGYIDGKYMDLDFLRAVADRGSDPARYAFHGSQILFSRVPEIGALLAEIVRYPVAQRQERIDRFVAQLLAWRWYYSEAQRQQSAYLTMLALQKIVLFSSRVVLALNDTFFPYHKWMLRVLESVPRRPPEMLTAIDDLLRQHTWTKVDEYCRGILAFAGIDFAVADPLWPTRFMKDTELRWLTEEPAIDEI